ncbi:SRPBCC family protein [Kitasatospora sp. LaBMicrA B282]|uniref:SRPBCC family protein n=1 Tax=Kitasatospora sp. LaBMicrA B282 TaxID=3420949 RepID=UPI003D0CBA2C
MTENWMVAELDPVRRLRVLAATVPGAMRYREIVLPAPMDRVWAVASDLEGELPNLLPTVLSFRYTDDASADTERRTAHAVGRFGRRADFEVVLRPGWCVMQSRFVLGAMAAVPEGGGTRFATLGGLRVPGARLLRPLTGLLGATGLRRLAEHPGLRE